MARRRLVKVIGFLRPCKSATLRSHYPSPKAVPTSLCPSSTQAFELGYTLGRAWVHLGYTLGRAWVEYVKSVANTTLAASSARLRCFAFNAKNYELWIMNYELNSYLRRRRMWLKCQEKQRGCFVCVYRFSTTSTNVSTDSANEGKKCLVKSGKNTQ